MTLLTRRAVLRRWRPEDRAPFAALNADPEVVALLGGRLVPSESDALIARFEEHFEAHGFGPWALEIPGAAPLAGFVGASWVSFEAPFTPAIEVGWRLARPLWGHGYVTEAAQAALADLAGRGLGPIVSFTVHENLRSRAVMERLGFTRDAAEDFDHPRLPPRHPLRRHVLYRLVG